MSSACSPTANALSAASMRATASCASVVPVERALQALLAEALDRADGVEHAVGEQHEHVAGLEVDRRALPVVDRVGAEHRGELADRAHLAVAHEQRQRMAGADELRRRRAGVAVAQQHRGDRAQRHLVAREQLVVERADRVERVVEQRRGGAQRVARQAGQRRRRRAAARHVADDRQPASVDRDRVVEVAADPVLVARRAIQRRRRPAGHARQAAGQQARLQRARDVRALGVQARVLDRRAGAARELLGERDVGLAEAPARFGADERQRPDDLAGGRHRDDDRAAQADAAQQLEMLGVLGRGGEHPGGHVVDDLGLAVAQDLGGTGGRVDRRRVALADAPGEGDLAGVDVRDGDGAQVAAAVGHAHRAPIGQLGHRQLGDLLQRALVVQRRRQQLARAREHALRELGALDLGDVLDDVDDELDRAVGVIDAGGLRHAPADLAGARVDAAHDERLGRAVARQQLAARQVLQRQGRSVLLRRVERVDELVDRRGQQFLRRRVAEHRGGRLVGVDERASGVLHGDRFGERREHHGELRLDRLELGEQPGVVERQRGAAGQHRGELEILARVGAPRVGGRQQRHLAEPATACAQRHDERGADLQRAQIGELLLVGGQATQEFLADAPGVKRLRGKAGVVGLQRGAPAEHGLGRRAAGSGGAYGQPAHLAAADGVDDADVGDARHDEVVECQHGVLQAARAVGDLGRGGQHGEALPVPGRARPVAGGQHGDRRDRGADGQPLEVAAGQEVVVPRTAQQHEEGGRDADGRHVAGISDQAADQRGEDDERHEDVRLTDRDVDRREQPDDRQADEQGDRSAAVPGRGHEAIIGLAASPMWIWLPGRGSALRGETGAPAGR